MKTFLLLIVTFLTTVVVSAQTNTWNHPEGGDWSDASMWSTGVVPTADDDVLIIGSVNIAVPVVAKSVVTGTGSDIFIFPDGRLEVNRSAGAALRMGDGTDVIVDGQLIIGSNDFVDSGIVANVGAHINIQSSGILSIQGVMTGDAINLGKDGRFENYGTTSIFSISNGKGLSGTNIDNRGTINIAALNAGDAITLVGDTLSNSSTSFIIISGIFGGSAIVCDSAAVFANDHEIYIQDLFNSNRSALQLSGGTEFINNNKLNISNTWGRGIAMDSATFTNQGSEGLLISGPSGNGITLANESHFINSQKIQLGIPDDPDPNVHAAINGRGIYVRSGSTFENHEEIQPVNVDGTVLSVENAVFDNYGTINGPSALDAVGGTISATDGSTFTNYPDAFIFTGLSSGINLYVAGFGTEFWNKGVLSAVGSGDIIVVENNGKMINDSIGGGMLVSNTPNNGLVLRNNGEFLNYHFLGFENITGEAISISNARFDNYKNVVFDNIPESQQVPPVPLIDIDPNGRFNNQKSGAVKLLSCLRDAVVFHPASSTEIGFDNFGRVEFGNITGFGLSNQGNRNYAVRNNGVFKTTQNGKMVLDAIVINNTESEINNADGTITARFSVLNRGTIINNGVFTQENNTDFINENIIVNGGTWNANGAFQNNDTVNNSHTFNDSGSFSNDGTIINDSIWNATGSFTNNALYTGNGVFKNSPFNNNANAIVSPGNSPGCMRFENGFINDGSLLIEVNDKATPCSDFDQLNVTGSITIAGELNVRFDPGYTPVTNDRITILKSTSLSGTFSNQDPAGWKILYNEPETGDVTLIKIDVLPLTLLSFDVKADGSLAKTTWKTSDEINTKHFELERSKDGITFMKLATIPSMNTGGDHTYSFTDVQPMNGRNYYRLRMVDIDGTYTNSKIISVDMNKPASSAITAVYPNPAKDVVNITVATNEPLIIDLVAPDGRRLLTKPIGSQGLHTINISGLAPGLYFLKVSNGEIYKLIKQ